MQLYTEADEIRDLVIQVFEQYGADDDALLDIAENIMIDEGQYMARTYRTDELMAMWLVQVGIVQFYDVRGNMLRTINLYEDRRISRAAA